MINWGDICDLLNVFVKLKKFPLLEYYCSSKIIGLMSVKSKYDDNRYEHEFTIRLSSDKQFNCITCLMWSGGDWCRFAVAANSLHMQSTDKIWVQDKEMELSAEGYFQSSLLQEHKFSLQDYEDMIQWSKSLGDTKVYLCGYEDPEVLLMGIQFAEALYKRIEAEHENVI